MSAAPAPLPALLIEPLVRAALAEDLGRAGDITTDSVIPAEATARTAIAARQPGRIAGLDLALAAWRLLDPALKVEVMRPDGSDVEPGDIVATVSGRARAMLTGERVALNFLCHLSGIATATRAIVAAVAPYKSRVTCTRKTMPGLRALQKYAVRAGGGVNHRFGLDDGILIKDNHIAIAGGIRPAIARARTNLGHMVKIEVEVDSLDQLAEALTLRVEAVLLDNMSPETLKRAVGMIDGRAIAEASGRITRETAPAIAAAGVDLISVGWLTHSAPALDLGLDFREG
ncbi:MAG TPA: carboxylating nicotinate-nucleotide diphosphorylase [Candidatus Sulfotelmatobacter sp.]|nr:carboxylating nicotinate-nucleotide diphosphorylase [Candidatus Sulfotelmatobacter sp.]